MLGNKMKTVQVTFRRYLIPIWTFVTFCDSGKMLVPSGTETFPVQLETYDNICAHV